MRSGHFLKSYDQAVALTDNKAVWVWSALLVAAVLLIPAVVQNDYHISLLSRVFILSIGAIGLTLLTGCTGLISLGHSGFMALGGYTTAILVTKMHWPLELALPLSGVVAALASLLVGAPSLRLKGLYLAVTTLAFGFIVNHVILYAGPLTNGNRGIVLPKLTFLGQDVGSTRVLYVLSFLILVLAVLAALNILRSSIGRAWIAIRDHDIAAKAMGVDLVRYKLLAFMVSSFFIGISGAMLALELRVVNVDVFGLLLSVEALAMILLGGMGSVAGAIIGTLFLTLLPEAISAATDLIGAAARQHVSNYIYQIREIIYGLTIILILRFEPRGLIAVWGNYKKFWTNWPLSISK